MEFNGINKVNIVKNPYLKQKTKKQSAKNEQKNQNKNLKNTPSNPSYWQSYVGIKNNAINLNNNNNISRPNTLGLNKETIASVNSNSQIPIGDGSTISVNDYINNLLSQKVGFKTKEEYQTFVLDKFTSHLNEMKSTYQAQEKDNGFISKLYDGAKELLGLGTSSKDAENSINKYEQMVQGLTDAINGKSDMTFEQAWEHYTGTPFSTEKIDNYIETSNMYSAVMVGCQYDENYLKNFEKTTGKSVNDVMKNYAQCQLDTFGEISEVKNVVDSYAKDQQTYSDKLSSIISTAGLACTVVGAVTTFFCPPVGIALMNASRGIALTGMFIDNAIDLVDNATDSDGLTKDEIKNLALETGVEAVSYAAGRGIGKFTNGLNSVVSSKVAQAGASKVTSYIAGQAAETVVDTALSLGADYAIAQGQSLITTGEFMDSKDYWSLDRFLGEGKNQLIGILTGLSSVKVSAYQQGVIKTAQEMVLSGDTDGAKTYLKKSGMKMNDTDFEGFVKNVQEVGTQVKVQTSEDAASNPVETEAIRSKIARDLYANLDTVSQETDSTCAIASLLNAIESKPALIQAIAHKFDYDAATDTYKFTMYGEDFEVKLNKGDNLLQKAYDAYQIVYGDRTDSVIDVFNEMLYGASDILVKPNAENIDTLRKYSNDECSVLMFNTTEDIDGLSARHSYNILGIDNNGNIRLQDPATLEEITVSKSEYESKNCQIEGKTYANDGLVDDNLTPQIVAGKTKIDKQKATEAATKITDDPKLQEALIRMAEKEGIVIRTKEDAIPILQRLFNTIEDKSNVVVLDINPQYNNGMPKSNNLISRWFLEANDLPSRQLITLTEREVPKDGKSIKSLNPTDICSEWTQGSSTSKKIQKQIRKLENNPQDNPLSVQEAREIIQNCRSLSPDKILETYSEGQLAQALDRINSSVIKKTKDGGYTAALAEQLKDALVRTNGEAITIVIPDDCSLSGSSILCDTTKILKSLNNTDTKVNIIFAPMVLGEEAQTVISQFNNTDFSIDDAYLKKIHALRPDGTENFPGVREAFKEIRGQKNVTFQLSDESIKATHFTNTETFREIGREDPILQQQLLYLMQGPIDGDSAIYGGFGNCGVMVITPTDEFEIGGEKYAGKIPTNSVGYMEVLGHECGVLNDDIENSSKGVFTKGTGKGYTRYCEWMKLSHPTTKEDRIPIQIENGIIVLRPK